MKGWGRRKGLVGLSGIDSGQHTGETRRIKKTCYYYPKRKESRVSMSSGSVNEDAVKTYQGTWSGQILPIISAAQLALFGLLAWIVRKHAAFPVDVLISRRMQKNHSPVLRYGTVAVSNCSKASMLNVLVIPLAAVLWMVRLRLEALMAVSTCLTAALMRLVVRQMINRPRPSPLLVRVRQKPHGKSFPSGHVISTVTFWGWLLIVGTRLLQGKPAWQKVVLGVPLLIMTLIGPSRIYVGDHWASDVLGGYLFGGGWLGLSLWLYRVLKGKGVLSS